MSKLPPTPFFILRGHEGSVSAVHFATDTDEVIHCPTLFSGSDTGEVFLWNLITFRTYHRLNAHGKDMIIFLYYYKSILLSQGREGLLNIWSFIDQQWTIKAKLSSNSVGFCSSVLLPAPNTAYIFVFDENKNTFNLYDCEKRTKSKELSIKQSSGMCMCIKAFHMDGKMFLLAGYEGGFIGLWDCGQETEISQIKCHEETVVCLDFDSQHRHKGISGSVDEHLETWTITEDLQLSKDTTITIKNRGINEVRIREDSKIVITAGYDSNIRIFSWKSLQPLAVLDFHKLSVMCIECCSITIGDRKSVFVSGSKDKNIGLWSIY